MVSKSTEDDTPSGEFHLPTPPAFNKGQIIFDQYQVMEELGKGGMGDVYKVHHLKLKTDLAMKSLRLNRESFSYEKKKQSFIDEGKNWMSLGLHPHIVSCYYVRHLNDDIPLLFAEYMPSGSLSKWIYDNRLYKGGHERALKRILAIAIQIAWGLHYIHEQKLIHRDVTPANIMMLDDDMFTNVIAKLTDFGISRARDSNVIYPIKRYSRHIFIKYPYRSPEQFHMIDREQSLKTDIWGWGVSVLEMFVKSDIKENGLEKTLFSEIPQMPAEVDELLFWCLQRQPEDRPANMLKVATELQTIYANKFGEAYTNQEPKVAEALASSHNNWALSLFDLNETEQAKRHWEQGIKVDPQHLEANYNQGVVLWREGKITDDTLIRRMELLRNTQYQNWLPAYLLAQIHLERGDIEAALPLLEDAVQLAPNESEVQILLTQVRAENLNTTDVLPGYTNVTYRVHLFGTLRGHRGAAHRVSLSRDGCFAVSGGLVDNTMQLWEVNTGRLLRVFNQRNVVRAVSISADGKLAIAGSGKEIWLWETHKKRRSHVFRGHRETVDALSLSVDGQIAISSSIDRVCIWDIARKRRLHTLQISNNWYNPVCISADGRLAITGGGKEDLTLRVWETLTGQCLGILEGHISKPSAVDISSDGKLAISGSGEDIRVWNLKGEEGKGQGQCLQVMQGHTHSISEVRLSVDGRLAISASPDYTMRIWEVSTGRCLRTVPHSEMVMAVDLSADGKLAASGSLDENIRLWKIERQQRRCTLRLSQAMSHTNITRNEEEAKKQLELADKAISEQDFSQALKLLRELRTMPGWERHPETLDAWARLTAHCSRVSFREAWRVPGVQEYAGAICVSANGSLVILAIGPILHVREVHTGCLLHTLRGHTEFINSVCISNDGSRIVSGSIDNTVRVWETATESCLHVMRGHAKEVCSVGISADGVLAVSGSNDNTVRIWDLRTGRCFRTLDGQSKWISTVSISTDGSLVVAGGGEDTIRVWEVNTGKCIHILGRHNGVITSVKLSADGRSIISGSKDTIRIWDRYTGKCLHILEGPPKSIGEVSVSTDGRWVASGGWNGFVYLWDVSTTRPLCTLQGHTGSWGVHAVCFSADGRNLFSCGHHGPMLQWELDWDLAVRESVDWDEGARYYLESFLNWHTPYSDMISQDHIATEQEVMQALTRRGRPTWTEEDFQQLLCQMSYAGYGWLRPEAIDKELIQLVEVRRIT